jgi:hypothetical protein
LFPPLQRFYPAIYLLLLKKKKISAVPSFSNEHLVGAELIDGIVSSGMFCTLWFQSISIFVQQCLLEESIIIMIELLVAAAASAVEKVLLPV